MDGRSFDLRILILGHRQYGNIAAKREQSRLNPASEVSAADPDDQALLAIQLDMRVNVAVQLGNWLLCG